MKGLKFLEFEKYLEQCNKNTLEISFQEIEARLGEALCPSAYKHKAYWSRSKTHVLPNAWLNAGYQLVDLDLREQKAKFSRHGVRIIVQEFHDAVQTDSSNRMESHTELVEKTALGIDDAIERIDKYANSISKDKHSRYLSWEHCYSKFSEYKDIKPSDQETDLLSLNLAFYLASWGMYRGSSFLLQKDYKIHSEAVIEICKEEYRPLRGIPCDLILIKNNRDLMFRLYAKLGDIYTATRRCIVLVQE